MVFPSKTRFFSLAMGALLGVATAIRAADCNGNGIDDAEDLIPQHFSFLQGAAYPVGSGPLSLVSADLDGDGRPDFATANVGSGDVSVLLNQGDGRFQGVRSYSIGGNAPLVLITADFNGDGKPDLATGSENSTQGKDVSVLINRGDGTFKDEVRYTVGWGPASVVAADFNGDGRPDLATGNVGSGDVSVLLNKGDGTFMDAVSYAASGAYLITADFNDDGKPDLATGGVSVLLNQGDGTFGEALSYATGADGGWGGGPGPRDHLVATDLNADGRLDYAMTRDGELWVFMNVDMWDRGPEYYDNINMGAPRSFIAADLDGDSDIDLAVEHGAGITNLLNQLSPPVSQDSNRNGIPDECEPRFHRGDPDTSGTIDITDSITIFGFLFLGDPPVVSCLESADSNNDGTVDISDGVFLLGFLFLGGPPPPLPGPPGSPCGPDPDASGSPRDLGCEFYRACE